MIKSFQIVTIFPELFQPLLKTRIFERAQKKVKINIRDLRDFASDKRRTVDDTPYGGGCGMIMKPEPLAKALDDIKRVSGIKRKVLYLTPQGRMFNQGYVSKLLGTDEAVLICGRYEGVDRRFIDLYVDEELSIGDYVIAGGELGAMVVMEAVLRMIPGVLGNEDSNKSDSFSDGLLEYPQYTRPLEFKGVKVPPVLVSGNHEKIRLWRKAQSLRKTKKARPDLFERVTLSNEDKKLLKLH